MVFMTIVVTLSFCSVIDQIIDTKYWIVPTILQVLRLVITALALRDFHNELQEADEVFILTTRSDAQFVLLTNMSLQIVA